MTIHMTAAGLRRAADALEALADIEAGTGLRLDGGHNGYVLAAISAEQDEVMESLRIVRLPTEQSSPLPATYVLEFEVP